jgi:hypothetical protein
MGGNAQGSKGECEMPDSQNQIKTPFDKVDMPPAAHSDKFVTESIERAKDNMGVITSQALHSELLGLTRDDWKRAAELFPKRSDLPNSFYIGAGRNSDFVIHNDMSEATKVDAGSIADVRSEIMKSDFKHFAGGVAQGATLFGSVGGLCGGIEATMVTGLVAVGAADIAILAAIPIAIAAVGTYWFDRMDAQDRVEGMKRSAANDLQTSRELVADASWAPFAVEKEKGRQYNFGWDSEAKRVSQDIKFN